MIRFYEVQIARVTVGNKNVAILTTITSPVIAETKSKAWREFCKRRQWSLYRSPSVDAWVRTITEVSKVRWEYLCACFEDNNHG